MDLLFINKVPGNRQAFATKVIEISDRLEIDPNWLMFLIDFETNGAFSASTPNKYNCYGLIQFCPNKSGGFVKTINGVDYTMDQIRNMTEVQQLELVYEYLNEKQGVGRKFYTYQDLYLAILWPKAVGQDDSYVITSSTNPIFDITPKDGLITVGEVKRFLDDRVSNVVPAQYKEDFKKKVLSFEYTEQNLLWAA